MINHLEGSFVGGLVNPTLVRSVQAVRMEHEEMLAAAGYDIEQLGTFPTPGVAGCPVRHAPGPAAPAPGG